VSLAKFFSRINDAISPLLTGATDLQAFLSEKVVCLEAPQDLEAHPVHLAGFILATNLCARLYPHLRILGPDRVVQGCKSLALQINPLCDVDTTPGPAHGALAWAVRSQLDSVVIVAPARWEVLLDLPESSEIQPSNILVSLAAASIGVGEVFRSVFAEFLTNGRLESSPGKFNLLTLNDSPAELPPLPSQIEIGRVHLAGAGAIGQAAIYTLARISATGTLIVVDPEQITLSNLQRYILTHDSDVDASKCSLAERALRGSAIEVVCRELSWSYGDLVNVGPPEVVCTAVDTEATRIGIQAGLPRRIYNAWTQPADLGWSRHEDFGTTACLACLYWPTRARPHEHELIAKAIRQSELRVLAYLTAGIPVDYPLPAERIPQIPDLPLPPEGTTWTERSLLDDIAASLKIGLEDRALWQGKQLRDLYREGICGGAIVRSGVGEASQEMAVPLAHQSALAGIMLAADLLIANCPELIPFRATTTEGRVSVLTGLPQIMSRPRQRSQSCLCSDPDFLNCYRSKWKS
jgi:hypothetical protein